MYEYDNRRFKPQFSLSGEIGSGLVETSTSSTRCTHATVEAVQVVRARWAAPLAAFWHAALASARGARRHCVGQDGRD